MAIRARITGCVFGFAVVLALGGSALFPGEAGAFAWKDTCYSEVYNATGDAVRLVSWLPSPPAPSAPNPAVALATYGAAGVQPGQYGILLSNTGIPATWGCSGVIVYGTSYGALTCTYFAPTSGSNSFSCNGEDVPYALQWQEDDDDLYVVVWIGTTQPLSAARGGGPTRLTAGRTRLAVHPGLHVEDLPGGAWRETKEPHDFGEIGRLWANGRVPPSCRSAEKKHGPEHIGLERSAFVRGNGAAHAGSIVRIFSTAAEASRVFGEALSRRSVSCLARILGSPAAGAPASTSVKHLTVPGIRVRSTAYRITVRNGAAKPGREQWKGYLDLVEVQRGREWGLLTFFSAGRPTASAAERDAIASVVGRMR